jgi:ATP-dependent DNA helicase RecG
MILPYRGLGSGIKRALDAWPEIDFIDDRDGCLFTATVHREAKTSSRKMKALPGRAKPAAAHRVAR